MNDDLESEGAEGEEGRKNDSSFEGALTSLCSLFYSLTMLTKGVAGYDGSKAPSPVICNLANCGAERVDARQNA